MCTARALCYYAGSEYLVNIQLQTVYGSGHSIGAEEYVLCVTATLENTTQIVEDFQSG